MIEEKDNYECLGVEVIVLIEVIIRGSGFMLGVFFFVWDSG